MKKRILKIFKILTVLTILSSTPASAASYSDVNSDSVLQSYLDLLSEKSIISGYPDGSFKPDQSINRAEALKIIFQTINPPHTLHTPNTLHTPFSDVPNDSWFTSYIISAKEQKIIKGYPDGTFKPAQEVNRAEFIKMAMRSLPFYDKINQKQNPLKLYSDLNPGEWYLESIGKASSLDFLPKTNQLQLQKPMLRADAAEIIYKISQYLTKHPSSLDPQPSTSFIPPESIISIDPQNIDNSPAIPKPAISFKNIIYEHIAGVQVELKESSGMTKSELISGQLSLNFEDGCFVDFLRYPFAGNIQHFYEENIEYGTDNMGIPEKEEFLELGTHNGLKRYQHHLYWNFSEEFQKESGLKNHNQDDFFFTDEHALSLNAHSPWKTYEECKPHLNEVIDGLSKTSL